MYKFNSNLKINIMTWTFKHFNSTYSGSALWNEVQNAANSLLKNEMLSLKIGLSDRISGNARCVFFYISNMDGKIPNSKILGTTWKYKAFKVSNHYESMYNEVVKFLNDPNSGLTINQKFWARISFDNAEDYDSHIVLWYRDMMSSDSDTK